jgi:outer membrane protein assembly factor BamB
MDQRTGDIGFGWFDGRLLAVQGDDALILTGSHVARLKRGEYLENSRRRRALTVELTALAKSLRGKEDAEAAEIREKIGAAEAELKQRERIGFVWSTETTDDKALLAAGNVVIVGGTNRVAAYSRDDGRQLWTAQVDGDVRGLSVANEHLLASTDTGAVICFGAAGIAGETVVDEAAGASAADATERAVAQQAAKDILRHAGVTAGYCLIVGGEKGYLAEELARQSELKIYCVEPSAEKVEHARKRLAAANLYGHRVVVHQGALDEIPYSNYFADLIVSETSLKTAEWPVAVHKIERHLRPQGGILCLGRPTAAGEIPLATLQRWAASSTSENQLAPRTEAGWLLLTRGALPGAGNWSHQYGNPGNSAISSDKRIRGDLGVLWYGDPGPGEMVNRHEGAVGPLSVNGKLFVQGETTILAYDAYNGRHLWTHENPKALRTGVFQNQNPGNLAASDDSLFHFIGDKCLQLDMATGATTATHSLPPGRDDGRYQWGYVAIHNGILFGTATMRQELASQLRRRGRITEDATDGLFAIDIATGKHLWSYAGKSISHHTIAIGPDRICFIDSSITSEQRDALLRRDNSELAKLSEEEQKAAEERLKAADVRLTVALDTKTGEKLWEQAVDVTDCSDIGIGGGKLTMMYVNDTLVLCGANANGHYWKQFVAGDFQQRRIVTLSAYDGTKLWAKDANYKGRPIVIGNKVIAEPWMFDLKSGEQITRKHPITGEESPWSVMRTGHHCGIFTGCDSGMLLFRSGATGFMDLNADEGIRHFAGHRLGCWVNAIAANGLVMIPEASAGCVCQFSIASTIVMEPRETRRPWTIYSAIGASTPVKNLSINLGAPGDRKDALGTIWFSYPRRDAYQQTTLDVRLDLRPRFRPLGGFDNIAEARSDATAETSWIYTSWAAGLEQLTLPLLGENDAPATYTIRLHFADGRAKSDSPATFDVSFNGNRVIEGLALETVADGPLKTVVREFRGVPVQRDLVIDLESETGTAILNAIEAIREESAAK